MAGIPHHENRHDVNFSAQGGPIWIKFRRVVQNDMSTAVIWSKSKPDIEFQYGGRLGEFSGMSSLSHLPHCRMLPPGAFNYIKIVFRVPKITRTARTLCEIKGVMWEYSYEGKHLEKR